LRELDERGFDLIIVEAPPAFGAQWEAVRDRLQRAAAGSGAASNERADDDAP
jgi:hypothetical protein